MTDLQTERGIVRVPAGTWKVDPAHSSVGFEVKHMMIATVRGRFTEFDGAIGASVPVLVDFWAPWCGPCRMVSPAVEAQARERAGQLKVVKLNIDDAADIAGRYGVQSIPLLVLVRDGEEVDRQIGAVPPAQLRSWLDRHTAAAA
jgi:thioredoxin 2